MPPTLGFIFKWVLITNLVGLAGVKLVLVRIIFVLRTYFYLQAGVIPVLGVSVFSRVARPGKVIYLLGVISLTGGLVLGIM